MRYLIDCFVLGQFSLKEAQTLSVHGQRGSVETVSRSPHSAELPSSVSSSLVWLSKASLLRGPTGPYLSKQLVGNVWLPLK